MKNILKILCVVSASSVFVMIVFNRANSNELPAKDQQQSKHEYVISPDDPILTYRVGDSMWYETVLEAINNDSIKDKLVRKEMCRLLSTVWKGENKALRNIHMSYDEFTTRSQKQMELIGARLLTNPVIFNELIVYKYKIDTPNILPRKSIILRHAKDAFEMFLKKDFKKIKSDFYLSYAKKFRPLIKKHLVETGVGDVSEAIKQHRGGLLIFPVDETGVFRASFSVSKKGFQQFYDNPKIQKPPPYFEAFFDYLIEAKKLGVANSEMINYGKRKTSDDDLNRKYLYKLEFLGAERQITTSYQFVIPMLLEKHPKATHWSIEYIAKATIPSNGVIADMGAGVWCSDENIPYDLDDVVTEKLEGGKPYFIQYSWKEIMGCKPYKYWLMCHKLMKRAPKYQCDEVPVDEPEMCAE